MNSKRTVTLTQYNNPLIGWSQVSFSEFWVELLNAKDWAVYQIEAIKKFYLAEKFETAGKKEILKKYENNRNFVKYGKFPRNVLSRPILLWPTVSKFLY